MSAISGSQRPLEGRRLLVTRPPRQAGRLVAQFEALGADVALVPAIAVEPPQDPEPLDRALRTLERYDWLLLTSQNAVRFLAGRLAELGLSEGLGRAGLKVGSVGPATSGAFRASFPNLDVDLEPAKEFRASALAARLIERLPSAELGRARFLIPTSDRARPGLGAALRAAGAEVDVVVAYRTLPAEGLAGRLRAALEGLDLAVFASPSAVEAFVAAIPEAAPGLPVALIGPVTAEAARAAGMQVRVVARPSTDAGLVAGIQACLGRERP
jgi:uroporphyrinogen III methyltransferase/synthase